MTATTHTGVRVPRPVTPLGLLTQRLADLSAAVADDTGVSAEVRSEIETAHALASGLDPYLRQCTSEESPELATLAARTAAEDWSTRGLEAEMLSGHVEGQLLKFLVGVTGARRVLEVGMFTGYSTLAVAEALPTGGSVTACEVDEFVADFAQQCFEGSAVGRCITVRRGPASETLRELASAGERFDLVFLDADKGGYLAYLTALLDGDLLTPSAVVCVDNTLLQGEAYLDGPISRNGEAIREFNRAVAADPRLHQVMLPLRDGVTLIRRIDVRSVTEETS